MNNDDRADSDIESSAEYDRSTVAGENQQNESDGDWRAADKQSELQKRFFIFYVNNRKTNSRKCRDCGKIIQSSGNTKNIDISKRRILPGTSSIKDMSLTQKLLLAYSLKAIEN